MLLHEGRDDLGVDIRARNKATRLLPSPQGIDVHNNSVMDEDHVVAPDRLIIGVDALKPICDQPRMADRSKRAAGELVFGKPPFRLSDHALIVRRRQHRASRDGILVNPQFPRRRDGDTCGLLAAGLRSLEELLDAIRPL